MISFTWWGEAWRDLPSVNCTVGLCEGISIPLWAGMLPDLALSGAMDCSMSHWLLRDLSARTTCQMIPCPANRLHGPSMKSML